RSLLNNPLPSPSRCSLSDRYRQAEGKLARNPAWDELLSKWPGQLEDGSANGPLAAPQTVFPEKPERLSPSHPVQGQPTSSPPPRLSRSVRMPRARPEKQLPGPARAGRRWLRLEQIPFPGRIVWAWEPLTTSSETR